LGLARQGTWEAISIQTKENALTVVGILVVIILILLAIYLFQRVRTR
jgi:flagellar biogenesis protein FliO